MCNYVNFAKTAYYYFVTIPQYHITIRYQRQDVYCYKNRKSITEKSSVFLCGGSARRHSLFLNHERSPCFCDTTKPTGIRTDRIPVALIEYSVQMLFLSHSCRDFIMLSYSGFGPLPKAAPNSGHFTAAYFSICTGFGTLRSSFISPA